MRIKSRKNKIVLAVILVSDLIFFRASISLAGNSCIECHQALDGDLAKPAEDFSHDIHASRGLSCVDCHGGDPNDSEETAMAPEKGYRGVPARDKIPEFCASCHADASYMRRFNPNLPTDQFTKYLVSQHGKLNAQGDKKVAVCTSCHDAHGIRSKTDPQSPVFKVNAPITCAKCHANAEYMKGYGIPTDQFDEYSQSVHGKALLERGDRAAPACHSCHGSHDASRPKTIAIGNICAQCHAMSRDLFIKSPHKVAHDKLGLPECEVCHGNHLIHKTSDDMLGTGKGSVCMQCHKVGTKAFETAHGIKSSIEGLKENLSKSEEIVLRAEHIGMNVDESKFYLDQAKNSLTQARAYVHSFSEAKVKSIADKGSTVAQQAYDGGKKAIEAFQFRRKGFWVSALIILVLVVGIIFIMREIEK